VRDERRMALFFTGQKHAGENMAQLLKQRASGLSPPVQMCDALSRHVPKELETILANCLAHFQGKPETTSLLRRKGLPILPFLPL
jgi:hypothetical protein